MAEPRLFPALEFPDIGADDDEQAGQWIAAVDDFGPTAVDGAPGCLRIFFSSAADRDRAAAHVQTIDPTFDVRPVLVADDAWAERSQASLQPVRVDRIIVTPPWSESGLAVADSNEPAPLVISIQPSMGFGTGHHPSTRLCLHLLQRQALDGRAVIDIGTGSAVLAIAAARLGADSVIAVDFDPDAIASARENVERNGVGGQVLLETTDITQRDAQAEAFDLLIGNLTGGMLTRVAGSLVPLVKVGGLMIVSGFEEHERADVIEAFSAAGGSMFEEDVEAGWVACTFRRD